MILLATGIFFLSTAKKSVQLGQIERLEQVRYRSLMSFTGGILVNVW